MTEKTVDQVDLTTISELELASSINSLDGIAWRIEHDAGDGRIKDGSEVNKSLAEIRQKVGMLAEELRRRTGFKTDERLRVYIQEKVKEQNQLWDKQWEEIYTAGAVFKFREGEGEEGPKDVYETVRAYLPHHGTIGPNQIVLARIRDTGKFLTFDDRRVPQLEKLDLKPQYHSKKTGAPRLVKYNQEPEKRARIEVPKERSFRAFYETGAVFTHAGFNGTFEVYGCFNLPQREQDEKNEVVLARGYYADNLVEFTPRDLGMMVNVNMKPRYHKERSHCSSFVSFDLWALPVE